MAVVSSCCDGSSKMNRSKSVLLSQATSETCAYNCQRIYDRAQCRDCLGNKEEGAGYDRSVCSESSGLHARNNGRNNGMQHRKVKPILEILS